MDKQLMKMLFEEFGFLAEEIISRIICGESLDSAIQSTICR